ncbi:MAG: hypothetical protein KJP02_11285 [Octadecabacter sp.]|nr:hypothetical protein [Octadecabacter sp.]
MDPDLMLVLGLIIGGFSIPSMLGAFADGRVPRAAAIAVLIGGGLVALAVNGKPSGYALVDIPDVFVSVVARYIN